MDGRLFLGSKLGGCRGTWPAAQESSEYALRVLSQLSFNYTIKIPLTGGVAVL